MSSDWSKPGASPLQDIQRMMSRIYMQPAVMNAALSVYIKSDEVDAEPLIVGPDTLFMPDRIFVSIMRRTMTKRRFRRWKGKRRELR